MRGEPPYSARSIGKSLSPVGGRSTAANRAAWTRLSWTSYITTGIASALSGSVLPEVIAGYQTTPFIGGLFVTAPALGIMAAGLTGGILSSLSGFKRLLVFSLGCLAASVICIAYTHTFFLLLAGAALFGLGHGLVEMCGNAVIVELYPESNAQELNRLHLFFGIGSLLGPAFVALSLSLGFTWQVNYWLVTIIFLTLLAVVSFQADWLKKVEERPGLQETWSVFQKPVILMVLLTAVLLLATEQGITGWVPAYLRQRGILSPQISSLGLTIFWASVLAGRFANTHIPKSVSYNLIVLVEVCMGMLALLTVLVSPYRLVSLAGLGLTGFSIAGLYPAILASASHRHRSQAGIINGLFVTGVGLGKLIGPACLGLLAGLRDLSSAMYAIFFTFLGIAVVHMIGQSRKISV